MCFWRRYKQSVTDKLPGGSGCRKNKGSSGRKKKYNVDDEYALVAKVVPFEDRSTLCDLKRETGVPKSALHELFRNKKLKRFTDSMRPYNGYQTIECESCCV